MGSLVTVEEFSAYMRSTFGAEDVDTANLALSIASDKVRTFVRRSDGKFADSVSAPGDVKGVVLAVASRIWTNPTGLSQETAGAESVSYSGSAALTAAERAELRPYRSRAWTMELREAAP